MKAKEITGKPLRALILDFDGTLADTATCIVGTTQAALKELGYKAVKDDEIRKRIGLPLREMFELFLHTKEDRVIDLCTSTYEKLFFAFQQDSVRLFEHVLETLRLFRDRGWLLAVASSRGHNSLDLLCRHLGIDVLLSKTIADEDVTHKKPAPEMVEEILALFGLAPDEALVVGDTTYDIQMGQEAGCATCGVSYGNHGRRLLEEQGATYVIDDFGELQRLLYKIR